MKVHFIAIGGSVMHQLAIALKRKGYQVTGSDDEIFEPARSVLEKEGLLPSTGWNPQRITKDLDAVILGMHAKADNPELQKAQETGVKIFSFPGYIFEESRNKTRVVIGGSHGKTSTTAMIMHVLKNVGKDFDYLVGARLDGFEQSVKITENSLIVCEGDEYPSSAIEKQPKFHFLYPHIAVLTGIAWDHINVFPTFEIYLEQFSLFIEKIEKKGILIYNETDDTLCALVKKNRRKDISFIPYRLPDYTIENGQTNIIIDGHKSSLKIFGEHNLLNLQAAFLVCREIGLKAKDFAGAVASFPGASKRLEVLAANKSIIVFRDFAHAPSKVKATIDAVKQQYPERALIAVLELHTFSSLSENFLNEYKGSMRKADKAVVFYSKHALSLKRLPDLDKEKVKTAFAMPGLIVIDQKHELENWLRDQTYVNANLLMMSSGNYDGLDIHQFAIAITNDHDNIAVSGKEK